MSMAKTQAVEVMSSAVGEGVVTFNVSKVAVWSDVQAMRHKVSTGATFEPAGEFQVSVEIPGATPHTPLTLEQLAMVLEKNLQCIVPAARVFIKLANDDFEPSVDSF